MHRWSKFVFTIIGLVLMMLVGGCGDNTTSVPPTVTITPFEEATRLSVSSEGVSTPEPPVLEWIDGGWPRQEDVVFLYYNPIQDQKQSVPSILIVLDNSGSFVKGDNNGEHIDARNQLFRALWRAAFVWAEQSGGKVQWMKLGDSALKEQKEEVEGKEEVEEKMGEVLREESDSIDGTEGWENLAAVVSRKKKEVNVIVLTDGWLADTSQVPSLEVWSDEPNVHLFPVIFEGIKKPSGEPQEAEAFWKALFASQYGIVLKPKVSTYKQGENSDIDGSDTSERSQEVSTLWYEIPNAQVVRSWQEAFKALVEGGVFPGMTISKSGDDRSCALLNSAGEAVEGGIVCNAVFRGEDGMRMGFGLPIAVDAVLID